MSFFSFEKFYFIFMYMYMYTCTCHPTNFKFIWILSLVYLFSLCTEYVRICTCMLVFQCDFVLAC